jgi:hypothetical protein
MARTAPINLIADANGNLFGTTEAGGANGAGTVFELVNTGTVSSPSYASTPTTLVTFNGSNGAIPFAGVIVDANGDLFGTTISGGANNDGTVFELVNIGTVSSPSYASTPTTLVTFNGSNGAIPFAGLIADAKGDLFGIADFGGPGGGGTVFELVNTGTVSSPSYASTPTTLVSFDFFHARPVPSLIANANGDLFGTIPGGTNNDGIVFEITGSGFVVAPVMTDAILNSNGSTTFKGTAIPGSAGPAAARRRA